MLHSHGGFSLIELLVVVAIIAILATIGTSSLSGPQTSQKVGAAGDTVTDLARLARQNALSKNALTYLRVAEVTDAGQSRTAVSIWEFDASASKQVERWNLLPESIIATNETPTSLNFPTNGLTTPFRGSTSPQIVATYAFFPDGRMSADASSSSAIPKLKILPRSGPQDNFYELVFNPVAGTVKVNRPL